ncbi:hypothetical protein CLU79DRAFT_42821, partial [Phycomyces nitens]
LLHSPHLPCLDHSSPGSSQGYSEYDVRQQTPPAQVQHQSALVIRHYNPNGRPVVLNEDLEPINPIEYTCSVCFHRSSTTHNHNRHMETHSVDRPKFGCHLCHKDFTRKDNLDRHIKLHK